jgi:hypothetical protein
MKRCDERKNFPPLLPGCEWGDWKPPASVWLLAQIVDAFDFNFSGIETGGSA